VIRAKTLVIEEFRGIKKLSLDLGGANFAVCGPNGTGKSGIVDALEFALTGNISRLSGAGTGGLSVRIHGPHVDSRDNPNKASVSLTVYIPSLKIDATIVRTVRDAKQPTLNPNNPEVRAVFERVAAHPEFALSRREIIKYVLAEPGKRAREVQELLRLDEVESLRSKLQRIANACERDQQSAEIAKNEAAENLRRVLGVAKLSSGSLLEAANARRKLLGIPPFSSLEDNTSIKDGVVTAADKTTTLRKISKAHAKAEIEAVRAKLMTLEGQAFQATCAHASSSISALLADELFLKDASRAAFLRTALAAYDDQACPVCDTPFDPITFRQHLAGKLQRYGEISRRRAEAERNLAGVTGELDALRGAVETAAEIGSALQPSVDSTSLKTFAASFSRASTALRAFLPLSETVTALDSATKVPKAVATTLSALESAVNAIPDPTQQDAAREFLIVGQERLETYREASLKHARSAQKAVTARTVFDEYASVTTSALDAIYKNVEGFFSHLYRLINRGDEDDFEAHLRPSIGKLGFDVDFYGRGLFPPGAYHSEGHQDGMGLCLYLALMNHLAADGFTLAVLDDVLMSVDAEHRREVSKMLREQFPNTQFILTTHDEIWLKHMTSVGLIGSKRFAQFRTWSVDVGPTQWDNRDVWEELSDHVAANDIRAAAALLRNFLEHFSKEACQNLRASVEFHGDAQYALGDLLPSAVSKLKTLLKLGKASAQGWGQKDIFTAISNRSDRFAAVAQQSRVDEWQVNTAVHFNEWANLNKNDFAPVVTAFKALVEEFQCDKCQTPLFVTPEHGSTANCVRCACGSVAVNLLKKV
jgi:RecF/RecN/SMC family protein